MIGATKLLQSACTTTEVLGKYIDTYDTTSAQYTQKHTLKGVWQHRDNLYSWVAVKSLPSIQGIKKWNKTSPLGKFFFLIVVHDNGTETDSPNATIYSHILIINKLVY